MSRLFGLACFLTLLAAAAAAQTPIDLAALPAVVSSDAAVGTLCSTSVAEPSFVAARPGLEKDLCSAAANCSPYSAISCASSNSGDTCQGVDRNCSVGQRGYVRCGSSYTYCPVCLCTEGSFRYTWTGYCCYEGGREKYEEQCVNSQWLPTGVWVCSGPCGPIIP